MGEGESEEFEVKIVLRQGSVRIPLLFIAVLDLTSGKTVEKDGMKKDLAQWPWWRMANRSYRRHWRSGTGCLPDTG